MASFKKIRDWICGDIEVQPFFGQHQDEERLEDADHAQGAVETLSTRRMSQRTGSGSTAVLSMAMVMMGTSLNRASKMIKMAVIG